MKIGTLSNAAAIDLGTDNIRIYYKGTITDDPSVIAYDAEDGRIIAMGREAEEMIERSPDAVTVARPLRNGVITDYELACQMIQGFLAKTIGGVIKPRVLVSVPCGITDVERRAVCDAVRAADIREVFLIEAPIAGAIGANCDVSMARGMMLVDMGGGNCDIAAISLGQTVKGRSLKIAGDDFTEAVIKYVKEKHDLAIGVHTAERIKKEIGCAYQRDRDESAYVSGFNTKTRKPEKMLIHSEETREAFAPLLESIVTEIKSALDETPTELLGDIMEDGILLIGGGAQLYGMAKKLRIELGVKVFLAEDAEMCVVRGAGYVADNMDKMSDNSYVFTKG
ncbi:MAG: rod shape-determining protein [Clostridiales bacterium]|nr:rod shape-determining protein [Clostridiales bacterium]